MSYGTIGTKLSAGGYASAEAFASDVRLVTANAVLYSPEPTNPCHKAALGCLCLMLRHSELQPPLVQMRAPAVVLRLASAPDLPEDQRLTAARTLDHVSSNGGSHIFDVNRAYPTAYFRALSQLVECKYLSSGIAEYRGCSTSPDSSHHLQTLPPLSCLGLQWSTCQCNWY